MPPLLPLVSACLLLALVPGCSDAGPSSSAGSAAPSVTPSAGPSTGAGCDEDPVAEVVCRFVDAVRADDTSGLGDGEQEVAEAVGDDLPEGAYTVEGCVLVGDVTVGCEVSFAGQPGVRGFSVVPVNAEYDDGALVPPEGEQVRYEVVEHLGAGEPGDFTALP